MSDCVIEPASPTLAGVASVYAEVGFRPDLIDDLRLVRRLHGEVYVALVGGEVVGVSSCLPFVATGWVGGVAVRPTATRRGIGERLTRHAVDVLDRQGVRTALLHATPMARPLYERMGFRLDEELVELRGPTLPSAPPPPPGLRSGRADDLAAVLALDRAATGEDRRMLIEAFWPGGGLVIADDEGLRGFGLRQSPTSVGAVIADDARVGHGLVLASLATSSGEQRVGLPAGHCGLCQPLEQLGYTRTSSVTRMARGAPVAHRPDWLCTVFNLYWG